jgi:superfamily II DNA/RNA helicase
LTTDKKRRKPQKSNRNNRNRNHHKKPNLYTPAAVELAELSDEQKQESRVNFGALSLGEESCNAAIAAGFVQPTPIQKAAIPHVADGKDLIGLARTGGGKTAVFLLPTANMKSEAPNSPSVVALVPTRELAVQIEEQARRMALGAERSVVAVFGGVDLDEQRRQIHDGCDLIVATPGRLLDLVEREWLDLSKVKTVVLDEADRMLDLGFSKQIRALLDLLKDRDQTLLFSATMPVAVERLASFYLKKPERVDVNATDIVASTVEQAFEEVRLSSRMPKLLELVQESVEQKESVLVFAGTKANVEMVYRKLQDSNLEVDRIHSSLNQQKRIRVLKKLADGEISVLVATDVAARGLDIPSIGHVINFDLPNSVDDYVHRVGRTGRHNATGKATSLVTPEKRYMVAAIKSAEKKGRTGRAQAPKVRRSMSFRPGRRR